MTQYNLVGGGGDGSSGRRRYLSDINSANAVVRGFAERNAINAPVQGSAADIIKLAMIEIDKELREGGFTSKMILQVHDELVFELHRDDLAAGLDKQIVTTMQTALPLSVPVLVQSGVGDNWLVAH